MDAYTTVVGLSKGLRESEALALFLINNFGVIGFLLFKISVPVVITTVAVVFDDRLREHGEFSYAFYMSASISLLCTSVVPVVSNLVQLGWL